MSTTVLVGIKYVGKRERPQRDTVAGTNLVWLDREQVHFVPEAVAYALLQHPDVWAEDGRKVAKTKTEQTESDVLADLGIAPPVPRVENEVQPPLVSLDTMDPQALIQFAQQHFGQKLPANMKVENMRTRIRNWMNSPVLAG